ncbi:MAG: hypothetical protein KAR15_20390, partial [Desulfobacterales bacterium]|nr:hypothetical protein [Desulfobacterales bacterium]
MNHSNFKMIKKMLPFAGIVVLAVLLVVFYLKKPGGVQAAAEDRTGTVIRGRVVSSYGPVENARVRIIGEENYALTDRQGRYELQTAPSPGARIIVTAGKEGWFNN